MSQTGLLACSQPGTDQDCQAPASLRCSLCERGLRPQSSLNTPSISTLGITVRENGPHIPAPRATAGVGAVGRARLPVRCGYDPYSACPASSGQDRISSDYLTTIALMELEKMDSKHTAGTVGRTAFPRCDS